MQSSEGYLSVTGGKHRLFYRVDGPCDGLPVFIFHGGWGPRETDAACCEGTGKWRIVQLHQKGWGKSMPAGEVTNNTPMDVLADVEALRMHLGVQRWFVKGGSTGAMLAVLYAVEYPLSVSGVLMVGTWLLRTKDIDWCYRGGMGHFYPGEWKAFKQHVACRGGDPLVACWRMVFGEDKIVGMAAAQAFMKWDGTCGQLVPDPPEQRVGHDPEHAMVAARIALHWYVHMKEWFSDAYILDKVREGVLRGIPVSLVNGRYDLMCPPQWSHETCEALEEGGADWNLDYTCSGHAGSEPANIVKMKEVMTRMAQQLQKDLTAQPSMTHRCVSSPGINVPGKDQHWRALAAFTSAAAIVDELSATWQNKATRPVAIPQLSSKQHGRQVPTRLLVSQPLARHDKKKNDEQRLPSYQTTLLS